jgi:hypothetical protein
MGDGCRRSELFSPLSPNLPARRQSQYRPLYTAQSEIYYALLAAARSHKYIINLTECLILFTLSSHKIIQELDIYIQSFVCHFLSVTVAARSKAKACGHSLAGIVGWNPARVYGCLPIVTVTCCQV